MAVWRTCDGTWGSRVVAGVWRDGKVLPVHTILTMFVGIYPKGETPLPRDVAASRDRG